MARDLTKLPLNELARLESRLRSIHAPTVYELSKASRSEQIICPRVRDATFPKALTV